MNAGAAARRSGCCSPAPPTRWAPGRPVHGDRRRVKRAAVGGGALRTLHSGRWGAATTTRTGDGTCRSFRPGPRRRHRAPLASGAPMPSRSRTTRRVDGMRPVAGSPAQARVAPGEGADRPNYTELKGLMPGPLAPCARRPAAPTSTNAGRTARPRSSSSATDVPVAADSATSGPRGQRGGYLGARADAGRSDGVAVRRAHRRRAGRPPRRWGVCLGLGDPRRAPNGSRMRRRGVADRLPRRERDIATVVDARPDVFAHNLETVRRLHARIRPATSTTTDRSRRSASSRACERSRSRSRTSSSAWASGPRRCSTPCATSRGGLRHRHHRPVPAADAVPPSRRPLGHARGVRGHKADGEALGITHVEAGPLVRSSYHAGEQFRHALEAGRARVPASAGNGGAGL